MAAAARRVGRDPAAVQLVAVSKTVPAERIRELAAAGQQVFGENRAQELVAKADALQNLGLVWHMVGHLQRNKVRHVAGRIAMLHSLDSLALAQELDRRLERVGRRLAVLIEVNTSGEPTKFGVQPEAIPSLIQEVARIPSLEIQGLMTIGPNTRDESAVRQAFRLLAGWFRRVREGGMAGAGFQHLSMGMSGDFEWAIEEGATMVRVGTALFGPRPPA